MSLEGGGRVWGPRGQLTVLPEQLHPTLTAHSSCHLHVAKEGVLAQEEESAFPGSLFLGETLNGSFMPFVSGLPDVVEDGSGEE